MCFSMEKPMVSFVKLKAKGHLRTAETAISYRTDSVVTENVNWWPSTLTSLEGLERGS